jgi:hypothetical protein
MTASKHISGGLAGRPEDETTINLKYISYWQKPIQRMMSPFLTDDLLHIIKPMETQVPADIFYYDLEKICYDTGVEFPGFEDDEILEFMYGNYKRIIGFHATKLPDITIPYREGLKTLSLEDYYSSSKTLFKDYTTDEKIRFILEDFKDRINGMTIEMGYFKENYDDDFACNFLIFGSETLLGIANHLDDQCRDILRKRNIPLIYTCSVPIEYVAEFDIIELFKRMAARYFMKLNRPYISFGYGSGYSFTLKTKILEKQYIIGHKIVTRKIYDQFDRMCYQYTENKQQGNLS